MCKVTRRGEKPGPPRSPGSPKARPALASLLGYCSQEAQHAHSAQTEKARLAARGRPTLMTAAQVAVAAAVLSGSGLGSALVASRRDPAPRAAASSPSSLAGGACGRGRGLHKPRPRALRGHPSFPHAPEPRSWPQGAGFPTRTRAQNRRAHRCAHAAVIGAGSPETRLRLGTVRPAWLYVSPLPVCVARDKGRDPQEPPFAPR